MEDGLMTVPEVARYLKVADKTVLRMIHKGEIPCVKIGSQWRFTTGMIEDWLISKMQVLPRNDVVTIIENSSGILPMSRLTGENLILPDLKPGTKEEILGQLIVPLVENGAVKDEQAYLKKLMRREAMVSTALAKGVAFPHIRNPRENHGGRPALVIGVFREGTDFSALDGQSTYLFFLLCTDSEVVHLRVLGKLSGLFAGGIC